MTSSVSSVTGRGQRIFTSHVTIQVAERRAWVDPGLWLVMLVGCSCRMRFMLRRSPGCGRCLPSVARPLSSGTGWSWSCPQGP